jgi:hypothetical protein
MAFGGHIILSAVTDLRILDERSPLSDRMKYI